MSHPSKLLLLLGPVLLGGGQLAAQPGGGALPVVAAKVVQREVTASQSYVGTVTAVKRVTIGSAVAGRVTEVPFDAGDRVGEKQALAQLLTATISLDIAAAEGELALRTSRFEELEAGTRPEDIRQAEAREKAAAARRDFLVSRRDRLQGLFNQSRAITEEELQEAVANAAEAEQVYLQAKAAHELAVAGPRKEVIAQAAAQVTIQRAVVEKLSDQRRKYTVRSKFDGYVVAKHTEIGDWLNPGDPVADVVAVDPAEIEVKVGEKGLQHITPGMTTMVTFPALPGQALEASVFATIPNGDLRTRTFPVRLRLPNKIGAAGPLLRPGMYARVRLPTGGATQAVLVPKDAIIHGGPIPMLYVARGVTKAGQSVEVSPLATQLGLPLDGKVQVFGQLSPQDLVIVQGNERLRPKQVVTITKILD